MPNLKKGWGRRFLGFIGAAFAFLIFAFSALLDRTATASVAASLCIAISVFAFLDLESFEGFGIKASLRRTLNEAEQRIRAIDNTLELLSETALLQASRGSISDDERQEFCEGITANLEALGLDEACLRRVKIPLFISIGARLQWLFRSVRSRYLSQITNELETQLKALPINSDDRIILNKQKNSFYNSRFAAPAVDRSNYLKLRELLILDAQAIPVTNAKHTDVFKAIAEQIASDFDAFIDAGNYTPRIRSLLRDAEQTDSPFFTAQMEKLR